MPVVGLHEVGQFEDAPRHDGFAVRRRHERPDNRIVFRAACRSCGRRGRRHQFLNVDTGGVELLAEVVEEGVLCLRSDRPSCRCRSEAAHCRGSAAISSSAPTILLLRVGVEAGREADGVVRDLRRFGDDLGLGFLVVGARVDEGRARVAVAVDDGGHDLRMSTGVEDGQVGVRVDAVGAQGDARARSSRRC